MGRRKCSSFPACFVGDDSLVLFSCLLFYVDEEQRDSPSRQVSWGFFLESFFLFLCFTEFESLEASLPLIFRV